MKLKNELKLYNHFNSIHTMIKIDKFEKFRNEYVDKGEDIMDWIQRVEDSFSQKDIDNIFEPIQLKNELNRDLTTKQTNKEKRIKI